MNEKDRKATSETIFTKILAILIVGMILLIPPTICFTIGFRVFKWNLLLSLIFGVAVGEVLVVLMVGIIAFLSKIVIPEWREAKFFYKVWEKMDPEERAEWNALEVAQSEIIAEANDEHEWQQMYAHCLKESESDRRRAREIESLREKQRFLLESVAKKYGIAK